MVFTFLRIVTLWSRSTSNFYALTGQNFVSTCDVFSNCLFSLDVQNEIQLLPRVFCQRYSWLVCLLNFWLRNALLVKVGNPISDGIVFVFHLAGCVSDSGLT